MFDCLLAISIHFLSAQGGPTVGLALNAISAMSLSLLLAVLQRLCCDEVIVSQHHIGEDFLHFAGPFSSPVTDKQHTEVVLRKGSTSLLLLSALVGDGSHSHCLLAVEQIMCCSLVLAQHPKNHALSILSPGDGDC